MKLPFPSLYTIKCFAKNPWFTLVAQGAMVVATMALGITGWAAYQLYDKFDKKLDSVSIGQLQTQLGISDLKGDLKAMSAAQAAIKEARDRWEQRTEGRLEYLERRANR